MLYFNKAVVPMLLAAALLAVMIEQVRLEQDRIGMRVDHYL